MSVRTAARLPTSWWVFFDNGQTAEMPGVAMKNCVWMPLEAAFLALGPAIAGGRLRRQALREWELAS